MGEVIFPSEIIAGPVLREVKLEWTRKGRDTRSKCGRFWLYNSPTHRRIPRWAVFRVGVGVVDYKNSRDEAKDYAVRYAEREPERDFKP